MKAYRIIDGGERGAALGALGATVSEHDVVTELNHRGYDVEVHTPYVAPVTSTLTKSMAINVALDEAIMRMGLPRTSSHYYRNPNSTYKVPTGTWTALVGWVVQVANGYLTKTYGLPSWAQTGLQHGGLHGVAGGLGGFSEWLQQNSWFVQSVGDTVNNYGEYLTAKNVSDAIKANTDKAISKGDMSELIAALQQGGFVAPGKTGVVAEGAAMAASTNWLVPAAIVGGIILVVMLVKK